MKNAKEISTSVHTRTYYLAERKKKEDLSLAIVQTAPENDDILREYLDSALNIVKGKLIKKVPSYILDIELGILKVVSTRDKCEQIISLLEKSIEDFLVEYVIFRWMENVAPELANASEYQQRMQEMSEYISMLSPAPRRRPTNLAGI